MRALFQRPQVPKAILHYTISGGLLYNLWKPGKNVADYDKGHAERIHLINNLQDHHFLSLALIKKIIMQHRKTPARQSLPQVRSECFSPAEQRLPNGVVAKDALREAEDWGDGCPRWRNEGFFRKPLNVGYPRK